MALFSKEGFDASRKITQEYLKSKGFELGVWGSPDQPREIGLAQGNNMFPRFSEKKYIYEKFFYEIPVFDFGDGDTRAPAGWITYYPETYEGGGLNLISNSHTDSRSLNMSFNNPKNALFVSFDSYTLDSGEQYYAVSHFLAEAFDDDVVKYVESRKRAITRGAELPIVEALFQNITTQTELNILLSKINDIKKILKIQ